MEGSLKELAGYRLKRAEEMLEASKENLKNGTPHSRYFSDDLGVPNFLIKTQNKCLPCRETYCIIQI